MAEVLTEPIENYALSKKDQPKAQFAQVGIVGCGSTGQQLALVIAGRGIEVVFLEVSNEKIKEAIKDIGEELTGKINHWGMTEGEKRAILSRIKGTLDYQDFRNCDIVIEAILSKIREDSREIRKKVFKSTEQHVSPHCIIATNSTTIVITEFAAELEHKDRCISMHISTTAPDANVVEIVKGLYTSEDTMENVKHFLKLLGKKFIPVEESPGLITVRLFAPLINEACDILIENVARMEDIDFAMRNGFGMPLGPFEMADKIGLDRVVRWLDNLYNEFGDLRYKASPLLKRYVRGNQLGRKTLHGFYKYDDFGQKICPNC
jgi:3-hydroxybutyryl-CoA dehydrogenase